MKTPPQTTPEAAALLCAVRESLGLSLSEMADALGMQSAADSGADRVRQMERGARPVSGPVHVLLRYMAGAGGWTLNAPPDEVAAAEAVRARLQQKQP